MSREATWATSRFTGLFTAFDRIRPEPHDPAIELQAATLGRRGPQREALVVGGAGWSLEAARGACVGEALERFECWPRSSDGAIEASFAEWPLDEPALDPEALVLFSRAQYESEGWVFAAFDAHTRTRWVAFRRCDDGTPLWLPEELAGLHAAPGSPHGILPMTSTGLSAGGLERPLVLRGLQEVIERDALTRAWWGEYALEEIDGSSAFARLGAEIEARVRRPHLTYRFFRIDTPHAAHVTLVTTEGREPEWIFSTGSACRETRAASLEKALLEALQGRHYVRHRHRTLEEAPPDPPADFGAHVLHYSLHPERLASTVLEGPHPPEDETDAKRHEGLAELLARAPSPVVFRLVTPPSVTRCAPGFLVVKVVAPGLVPLHGDHRLAHLGAARWRERPLDAWLEHPPHPFA